MKIWATQYKNNKRLSEFTAISNLSNRQAMIDDCLYQIAYHLDLPKPIMLPKNQRDLSDYFRTLLTEDCFVEPIPFDYLELEIAPEDN